MLGLGCCGGAMPYYGLGQDDGSGDDGSGDIPISTTTPLTMNCPGDPGCPGYVSPLPSYTCADGAVVTDSAYCAENIPSVGGTTGTGTGNTVLATDLSNLAALWTKIAGNVIAPQTTITTPTGLQVSTSASQTSALASLLGGTSLSSSTLSSWLPLLLIAGVGIVLFSAMSHK
jgi:hypothetical protein